MSSFNDFINRLFGSSSTTIYKNKPAEQYDNPGIVQEFFNKLGGRQKLLSPVPEGKSDYNPPPTQSPYVQKVETPQEQYGQPVEIPQPNVQTPKYTYYDKPPIPDNYAKIVDTVPNSELVGSVLAQETGGYGYNALDPKTGEVVGWNEAKRQDIRGAAGEVGIAQIIPKWYWKEAGFPDEESYAQRLYDPEFAIKEAARITAKNIAIAGGDIKKALGRWNKSPSYPDEILARIGQGGE